MAISVCLFFRSHIFCKNKTMIRKPSNMAKCFNNKPRKYQCFKNPKYKDIEYIWPTMLNIFDKNKIKAHILKFQKRTFGWCQKNLMF